MGSNYRVPRGSHHIGRGAGSLQFAFCQEKKVEIFQDDAAAIQID
jgi:hypothetical protein